MVSLSLIEKDSIATTRYSFKDCILACKIRNQMHINFEKKKFHKKSAVILLKNGCSVRHMFCAIFVPLSVAKVLAKYVQSNSFGIGLFQRKFTFTCKIYWTTSSIIITLHQIFRSDIFDIFQNSYFWLVIKSTKFIKAN